MEIEFTEKKFKESFVKDLMDKAEHFSDDNFSIEYINDEIKPLLNVAEFMYVHDFISKKGYYQCKVVFSEIINNGKKSLEERNFT